MCVEGRGRVGFMTLQGQEGFWAFHTAVRFTPPHPRSNQSGPPVLTFPCSMTFTGLRRWGGGRGRGVVSGPTGWETWS